ncbi:probable tyrosyl-DNA phosphodiesterase [Homalodisca vitripennis]|uniref:probable tyrosyl-DNA phosphodiesterase n=1 Tax=Homalodisca vitripennis TaxID=197043 RepID=UPI001EEB3A87|nr:probable tyrosyl-DNA phosphodiesterase [Homalodisca vitripennis]
MKDCRDTESNSGSGNIKKECDYGDRCYRKNPAHFQEFSHQHLHNLLETCERKGLQSLPEDFRAKISRQTVLEQLNILRSLKSSTNRNPTTDETQAKKLSIGLTETTNVNSENKKPSSSIESSSTSQRKRQSSSTDFWSSNEKGPPEQKRISPNQSGSTGKQFPSTGSSMGDQSNKGIKDSSDVALSSEEHRNRMQQARNMDEAMKYFQDVKKRSQGNICEKHKAAAPYYFFLTSVTDSRQTHKEPLSIQMFDILDPSLGDLESSLQINFMVEFGWLMAQYYTAQQRGKPLTLLYGEMDVDKLKFPNVTAVNVKPPSPFGSHHTKMCVMAYRDGSVRVCVHTANLVESDWDNRVQGVWLSPLCPALPLDTDSTAGESPTNFKQDLILYLSAYRLPELQPWISKLRRADFSHINVFFVASTPGSHKGVDSDKWGHAKLSSLLKRHVQITPKSSSPPPSWQIIAQCSSIGSLGPQPTAWFCGEVKQAMSGGMGLALQSAPPIRLVYPTFDNVAGSYDGLLGGGCLPYSKKTHEKQPWLQQYLYQWKSDSRNRTRAMPHIKTYCRVSPDLSQLAWFHLTSANLSKAAWGSLTKAGAISILSYEAGVLFLPKFVVGSNSFPIKEEVAGDMPVFPMPYDLPLTPFSSRDVPWFMDNLS